MQKAYECSVCYKAYSTTDAAKKPHVLLCGHTFCKSCIQELHSHESNKIQCPCCKRDHFCSLDQLPINYTVMAMMDGQVDEDHPRWSMDIDFAAMYDLHMAFVLYGMMGAGKSTIFNSLTGANVHAAHGTESVTQSFWKTKTNKGHFRDMHVSDCPGVGSDTNVYKHAILQTAALTNAPVRGIFCVFAYGDSGRLTPKIPPTFRAFYEKGYMSHVSVIVNMMDLCPAEERSQMKEQLINLFEQKYKIDRVHIIFHSKELNTPEELLHRIALSCLQRQPKQLEYSNSDFVKSFPLAEYTFEQKMESDATKSNIDAQIEQVRVFISDLQNSNEYNAEDIQEILFAAVPWVNSNVQALVDVFLDKWKTDMQEHLYYGIYVDLLRVARDKVKILTDEILDIGKEGFRSTNENIKKCPFCGIVWVKTEGCNGRTTCGSRPSNKKDQKESFRESKYSFSFVGGIIKVTKAKWAQYNSTATQVQELTNQGSGCGREIIWSQMAGLSELELANLYVSVPGLEVIVEARPFEHVPLPIVNTNPIDPNEGQIQSGA